MSSVCDGDRAITKLRNTSHPRYMNFERETYSYCGKEHVPGVTTKKSAENGNHEPSLKYAYGLTNWNWKESEMKGAIK